MPNSNASLTFTAEPSNDNPYLDVVDVEFQRGDQRLTRPAFWKGKNKQGLDEWEVRFNPPAAGVWQWKTHGLPQEHQGENEFVKASELLKMSPGKRSFVWADGSPYFPVCDTAWSLPWRATLEETEEYVSDRKEKGFNAALLMTVQPDRKATGPTDPTQIDGFQRGFEDLPRGRLTQLNPEFFDQLDTKILMMLEQGIVPFHTPLFFGFGWKGLDVIGPHTTHEDAQRFIRYLFARYGAWPGVWLIGADGRGTEPAVESMATWLEQNDWAHQPRGIHYNPWQQCDAHWNDGWCHFHLCQTGHDNLHLQDRVTHMSSRSPVRGVGNGEPTYEGMTGKYGLGDWQMIEAWANLAAGGTLGCWYGAASLWQWKREGEHWDDWACAPWDWREAMHQPGSNYPGLVGKALQGYDYADASLTLGVFHNRNGIAKAGKFAFCWLPDGGKVVIEPWGQAVPWRALCAKTLDLISEGAITKTDANGYLGEQIDLPEGRPIVVLYGHRTV
jgi:hypothetical protein